MHRINLNTAINCTVSTTIYLDELPLLWVSSIGDPPFKVGLFKTPFFNYQYQVYNHNSLEWERYDNDIIYLGTGDLIKLGALSVLLTHIDVLEKIANLSLYSDNKNIMRQLETDFNKVKCCSVNLDYKYKKMSLINSKDNFNLKEVKKSLKLNKIFP